MTIQSFKKLPDFEHVLLTYQEDERLNRFAKKLEREVDDIEKIDWEDLKVKHTLEAYWTDIGGEGA